MSKKIRNNIDTGLWADYGDGYTASAWQDMEEDSYHISYHKGAMPAFNTESMETLEELEAKMRECQPDLRKWRQTESG